jgi:hypothetical protein
MKYSKRNREQAALICAIAASTPDLNCNYAGVREGLGLPAYDKTSVVWGKTLESAAWRRALSLSISSQETDAEAEALIRTGWSP